ncbi:glycosyl hydrolase family 10 protein [Ascobolus immersus RN42]|uniref:Beta-xylanase n=1 Tax=Ascobolus immersus RN42 TaxID=1160509 RepID=A0A3N4I9Q9_ASCIM|nr:glycosyl hydrolase family 10 protein [Ascobolus immersus RN42]
MKFSSTLLFMLTPAMVMGLLDQKMKAKGKRYFGTALDAWHLSGSDQSNIKMIAGADFGAITHENSLKWDAVQPQQGNYQFGNADAVVNWATSNNRLLRGHTLVWHSQLPQWVHNINSASQLTQVIQNHINTVMGRYRGRIYAWDVVNEVFEENGTFRNSVFYRLLGENFIDIAFRAARNADPNAKLYINDYNLDGPGPKIDAMIALIGRLRSRGVPIDGVGTQAHLILGQVGGVQSQLQRLAGTGLDVAITELDIRIQTPVTAQKLDQQYSDYQTVTRACLNVPRCVGISVWGISDKHSWVDSTFPSYDAPLLWDDWFNRKNAYWGVDNALN